MKYLLINENDITEFPVSSVTIGIDGIKGFNENGDLVLEITNLEDLIEEKIKIVS